MNKNSPQSLIERIDQFPYSSTPPPDGIVPVYDHGVHLRLINEASLFVGRHGGSDLLLIVDGHTAANMQSLTTLRESARHVVVLGDMPQIWTNAPNVHLRRGEEIFQPGDHVFLLISSDLSLMSIGSSLDEVHDDNTPFSGGWSMHRTHVVHALQALLGEEAKVLIQAMVPPEEGSARISAIAMRLMALHASAIAERQQDIALEKNDLNSVLTILKAISSNRRAHDILFVFVEQIARIIESDRCSVVRVWGGESTGQVLASHEDASVFNHEIELAKYPELLKALSTQEKVIVNDVQSDPLVEEMADVLQQARVNAILVIPIVLFDQNIGSLFLRAVRAKGGFTLREISFFEIVTNAASNALERAQLFESIQIANESLERLATTDGLTGLYNHRFFRERLDQEVDRSLRYRAPLACMLFDIDNFKAFNDTYGHLMGDSILCEIAERTSDSIRKSDLVARYGGEEFVVIMPHTLLEGAMIQAERIRSVIASGPYRGIPEEVRVTVSIGVSVFDHNTMKTSEDLLRIADQAMYKAKRQGKNRVAGPDS